MLPYSPLLSGAAPGLECASCLFVDDIGEPVSLDVLLEEALAFFEEIGERPKRVSYQLANESNHRRASPQKFSKSYRGTGHIVGITIRSVAITSAGFEGDDISDTWTPRSVASVSVHGKTIKAFLQSSRGFEQEYTLLSELPFRIFGLAFSAAYLFAYPFVFSPLAYASGLSYSPNVKRFGDHSDRDSERVTNWSNHCYRGRRAAEGYLRDVYPINIIGPEHMEMLVGSLKLEDWIKQDPSRGSLSCFHEKYLWEVRPGNILTIQRHLDAFKVLLSGFPPHSTTQ